MPWPEVDGTPIPTLFIEAIKAGIKVHTLRTGAKWKAGIIIHGYEGNPRNKGIKADLAKPYGEDVCHGTERWDMSFNATQGASFLIRMSIEGVLFFTVTYCTYSKKIFYSVPYSEGDEARLKQISENDGLSPEDFLRWFIHLRNKYGVKEMSGQIVHWTALRYIADISAEITDS